MTTFWQVFFGVVTAWLVIQIALQPLLRRVTRSAERGKRLRTVGQQAIARAVVEELQRRGLR